MLYHNLTQLALNETDRMDFMDTYNDEDVCYKSVYGNACLVELTNAEMQDLIIEWKEQEAEYDE